MPAWGRRGSYVGVTATVTVLAVIGALAHCGRELIPPPDNNDLAGFQAGFLNRAARQGIKWRTTDGDPFSEAARLGRPVMVFAGTSASQAARLFDQEVFNNPEVWARLNRDFVCLRVDLTTEPEWRSAFLPTLRSQLGADPGYTVWFFKPNGQLLTWIGRRQWEGRPDFNDFLGSLAEVSTLFYETPGDSPTQSENEQRAEIVALRQSVARSLPDMDLFFSSLLQPRTFFMWQAGRYRALLQAGLVGDTAALLRRDLLTPRTDLVDGGFFRLGSWENPGLIEFDKTATSNAEMAAVLARAYVATGDPLFEYFYRRTVEAIESQFLERRPWSSYVENETSEDGRSLRNSFGVARLRTRVGPDARTLSGLLGLDPSRNPMMVPFITDDTRLLKDRTALDKAVAALRSAVEGQPLQPGGDDVLDASGVTVARVLEAAMVMSDTDTVQKALAWARRLSDFRAGTDEVTHSTSGRGLGRKWLGDFAAYADAQLAAYCATGDSVWLEDGERVLRRAIELFSREGVGEFASVAGVHAKVGPLSLELPSVVDGGVPPAVPLFLSVCFRYGAVLGDEALRLTAVKMAERYSSLANMAPTSFSAFFAVAQEVMLTGCVVSADRNRLPSLTRANPGSCVLLAAPANSEAAQGDIVYVRSSTGRLGPGSSSGSSGP